MLEWTENERNVLRLLLEGVPPEAVGRIAMLSDRNVGFYIKKLKLRFQSETLPDVLARAREADLVLGTPTDGART